MVQAFWSPATNATLISIANGLLAMVTQYVQVSFIHVKSHSNDPWNEAADKLCDRAGLGLVSSFTDVAWFKEWVKQPKFAEWAFLYVASPHTKEAYLPLCIDTGRLDARIPAQHDQLPL